MNPKYIIAGNRVAGKCYLRMGRVVNHKDLVVGYEHVWGGGWLERFTRKPANALSVISPMREGRWVPPKLNPSCGTYYSFLVFRPGHELNAFGDKYLKMIIEI
ncbi:MAG: hypothetical protein MJY61_02760 [Bacteroidales bacterium]|nr:hypothetical protein [Bacteroidales bacterium]